MIGITDTKKFLSIFNGNKIKIDGEVTDLPIPEQDAIYQAMKHDTTIDLIVPKEAFGFEFRSIAIPLKTEDGKIIGGLGIGFDLENSLKVYEISNQLSVSAEQTASVIEELSASAEELSNLQSGLQIHVKTIINKIEETAKLLQLVNKIASTSKMLGLNASIEAARAGEMGKGFSVVASEIRKMAESSTANVQDVKKTLDEINAEMEQIGRKIEHVVSIGQQQASATEEIAASTQELTVVTTDMKSISRKVIG